jgi:hypothetical protein
VKAKDEAGGDFGPFFATIFLTLAAWVFVAFGALHSAIRCTSNLVMLRFYLYLIATLAVWFIAIRAAINYFAA